MVELFELLHPLTPLVGPTTPPVETFRAKEISMKHESEKKFVSVLEELEIAAACAECGSTSFEVLLHGPCPVCPREQNNNGQILGPAHL